MAKAAKSEAGGGQTVAITLPIAFQPAEGYEAQQAAEGRVQLGDGPRTHIDAMLGPVEAAAFMHLRAGLRRDNAKLACGRPVWSNPDVLRWLMQQVAAQAV
ncbi:MAG: hypothetical protein V4719_00850 [Planctomycetota bacterium]